MSASVISGVDAPPVLEASKGVLDPVALAVEDRVVCVLYAVLGVRGNARGDAPVSQRLSKGRRAIGPVGEQEAGGRQMLQDCGGNLVIVGLSLGQMKKKRPPLVVADHLQLCGQTAPAASDTSG